MNYFCAVKCEHMNIQTVGPDDYYNNYRCYIIFIITNVFKNVKEKKYFLLFKLALTTIVTQDKVKFFYLLIRCQNFKTGSYKYKIYKIF